MKLLQIDINNLKSVTTASLAFKMRGDHQVSLLFGDNGSGKTTVLEAISLLGHVSTMRRICAHGVGTAVEVHPSSFREHKGHSLRNKPYEQWADDRFENDRASIKENGLDTWWDSVATIGGEHQPARIKYRVQFADSIFDFYILFLQNPDLSITEALSRDQRSAGDTIHDGNMDNWFAIVYSRDSRPLVEKFIEHMRLVSPHSYWNAQPEEYRTDPRVLKRPFSESIVAYWNTDLNDFGRKNDLRESVKKIRIDFKSQMITRLGLALPAQSAAGEPDYKELTTASAKDLKALNESLRFALVDHALAMRAKYGNVADGLIRITELDAERTPAVLMARRIGESKDIAIDHLSAGENESVFIFLLMHGMPCQNSLILLDEPDLHLSDFAKGSFYRELYRVASVAKCQLVISTHSMFAYTKAANFQQFFLRRAEMRDDQGISKVVYRTDWDECFGELLILQYARCATNAMEKAGWVWWLLSWPLRWSIWIGKRCGQEVWAILTIFVASLGIYSLGATLFDVFFLVGSRDPVVHRHLIAALFRGCVFWFITLVALRYIGRRRGC